MSSPRSAWSLQIAGIALTILYGVSQTAEAKISLQQVQNYIQDLQRQMLDRFDRSMGLWNK